MSLAAEVNATLARTDIHVTDNPDCPGVRIQDQILGVFVTVTNPTENRSGLGDRISAALHRAGFITTRDRVGKVRVPRERN